MPHTSNATSPEGPSTAVHRRALRRAARLPCQAVGLREFSLLGERTLDVSPMGLLLACDREVELGQEVLVSFQAPGGDGCWMDAEAEVARVIEGYREGDPGYCAGLRFTHFDPRSRRELLVRLAGLPPPIPARGGGHRVVHSAPAPVVVQPILELPAMVLAPSRRIHRGRSAPSGVFH